MHGKIKIMKKNVFKYYNDQGWKSGSNSNVTLDEEINVNNNKSCKSYNSKTRNRVLNQLDKLKGKKKKILDVASGPLHIPEYLEYSKNFDERHCVDFSKIALEKAKLNLANSEQKNSFLFNVDFFESDFKNNSFDAAISLHTLYHVDKAKQKDFVKKLIKYVRPSGLIIVVYSNPFSLQSIITFPVLLWRNIKLLVKYTLVKLSLYQDKREFYFKRKNIFWWNTFKTLGEVKIIPERTFSASFEKKVIPDNDFGKKIYDFLFFLESKQFWKFFSTYYIVIIKKI